MHISEQEHLQDQIMSFDLGGVRENFMRRNNLDEGSARSLEKELKRFFILSAAMKRKYGIKGQVDALWHEFIIHTHKYTNFCTSVFGGYLHHQPGTNNTSINTTDSLVYLRFLVDYLRFFKEPPPPSVWPFSNELFGDTKSFEIAGNCIADCRIDD